MEGERCVVKLKVGKDILERWEILQRWEGDIATKKEVQKVYEEEVMREASSNLSSALSWDDEDLDPNYQSDKLSDGRSP